LIQIDKRLGKHVLLKQKLIILDKPPLLTGNNVENKRAELKAYFEQTWELYESLFSLINEEEAFVLRPEPLRFFIMDIRLFST
jgi:hypothetical protein